MFVVFVATKMILVAAAANDVIHKPTGDKLTERKRCVRVSQSINQSVRQHLYCQVPSKLYIRIE